MNFLQTFYDSPANIFEQTNFFKTSYDILRNILQTS
jgi:hypothetical protein